MQLLIRFYIEKLLKRNNETIIKLILQSIFFVTVIVNAILIFFYLIAVYERFNGKKSLNPKEFLFSGIIILVFTSINVLFFKNKKFKF